MSKNILLTIILALSMAPMSAATESKKEEGLVARICKTRALKIGAGVGAAALVTGIICYAIFFKPKTHNNFRDTNNPAATDGSLKGRSQKEASIRHETGVVRVYRKEAVRNEEGDILFHQGPFIREAIIVEQQGDQYFVFCDNKKVLLGNKLIRGSELVSFLDNKFFLKGVFRKEMLGDR